MTSIDIIKRLQHGNLVNYGQHIYLYKHIKTNQVVYSLTQVMNVRLQRPSIIANNTN